MHWFFAEVAEKPECDEVEIAVEESVETEFRLSVFSCLVMYHFLANLVEAGIFCKIRNVSVHLTVNLNILYHVSSIRLQSAVEVVKVFHAANLACRSVEELGGNGFRQWVVTFLLISRYEVVAVLGYHLVETRNLVGRVLQVGVHGDDHVAFCLFETAE